jgi:hypothetical protein
MDSHSSCPDRQTGRVAIDRRAVLDRYAQLAAAFPSIGLSVGQAAEQEAEREAERLCDQLKEDGMSIIEIAEHIERRKPR